MYENYHHMAQNMYSMMQKMYSKFTWFGILCINICGEKDCRKLV